MACQKQIKPDFQRTRSENQQHQQRHHLSMHLNPFETEYLHPLDFRWEYGIFLSNNNFSITRNTFIHEQALNWRSSGSYVTVSFGFISFIGPDFGFWEVRGSSFTTLFVLLWTGTTDSLSFSPLVAVELLTPLGSSGRAVFIESADGEDMGNRSIA